MPEASTVLEGASLAINLVRGTLIQMYPLAENRREFACFDRRGT